MIKNLYPQTEYHAEISTVSRQNKLKELDFTNEFSQDYYQNAEDNLNAASILLKQVSQVNTQSSIQIKGVYKQIVRHAEDVVECAQKAVIAADTKEKVFTTPWKGSSQDFIGKTHNNDKLREILGKEFQVTTEDERKSMNNIGGPVLDKRYEGQEMNVHNKTNYANVKNFKRPITIQDAQTSLSIAENALKRSKKIKTEAMALKSLESTTFE